MEKTINYVNNISVIVTNAKTCGENILMMTTEQLTHTNTNIII